MDGAKKEPVYRLCGPASSDYEQTAPASEWHAAEMAASFWLGPPAAGGCQAVVSALSVASPRQQEEIGRGRAHAGSFRRVVAYSSALSGPAFQMRKVKAHRAKEEVEALKDDAELLDSLGNEQADEAAKLAATMHPQPAKVEKLQAEKDWAFCQEVDKGTVKMLPLWPMAGQMYGQRLAPPPRLQKLPK